MSLNAKLQLLLQLAVAATVVAVEGPMLKSKIFKIS